MSWSWGLGDYAEHPDAESFAAQQATRNVLNKFLEAPGELSVVVSPGTVSEGDGAGAASLTVTRSEVSAQSVTVTLASSDTSEAVVAPTATIPGGVASVTVPVDAVDDAEVDGTQTVTLSATAAGFVAGAADLLVSDDDTAPPLTQCPASMPLGDLGFGVAARDSATGTGYLMWTSQSVHTRFTPAP